MKEFYFIGAPFGYSANDDGCTHGPDFLRENGLTQKLRQRSTMWDRKITDLGNVEINDSIKGLLKTNKVLAVKEYSDLMNEKVSDVYARGGTPIIIGGDHSISIGTVLASSAYLKKSGGKLGLLWVDAHADINDMPQGNIHGKSVAVALGHVFQDVFNITERSPLVDAGNIIYIGIRDMMPNELKLIENNDIRVYGLEEIDNLGMSAIIKNSVQKLEEETDGVFLSFDVDSCDGSIFTGCGAPEIGGLTAREAIQIAYEVGKSSKFLGSDIVEFSPKNDFNSNTNNLVIKMIDALLGFRM